MAHPPPPAKPPPPNLKVTLLISAIVLVPLVGGVVLYRACSGGQTGDACADGMDCKPGSLCVSKRCAATCDSNADCPKGFRCSPFDVRGKMFGDKQTPIGASKACVR